MEIKIVKQTLSEEELEEIKEAADAGLIKSNEDDPEGFKKAMIGVETVVLTDDVAAKLEEIGITPDELIAMMLKSAGAQN